jgi:hypothetical protein
MTNLPTLHWITSKINEIIPLCLKEINIGREKAAILNSKRR